ncbi:acyltransferase family protein [Enterobacter asburiae]|uniref:acyltransferase family protein n=1 Tax=Enterobacter asburiae TaxID=61645 RepID=UPI0018C3137B|nr:acyltransferase [Enterobacter asburiae]MBF9770395.1 acyltransferase [Enterobacter asburiae]
MMIANIQYLRFLAAFLVIYAHANLAVYGITPQITNLGGVGVDIFFIISGFIMPYIIYGGLYKDGMTPKLTPLGFIKRRITRIWPLYLVATLVVVFISWLVDSGAISQPTADFAYIFNGSRLDLMWIIKTMTFMNFDKPPILGIGWTLQFEFLFYFLLAGLLAIGIKKANSLEFYSVCALVVFGAGNALAHGESKVLITLSSQMFIEFILGMYLYRMYSAGCILPKWLAWIGIASFFPLFAFANSGVFAYNDYSRLLTWGIPAFVIVWSALSLEGVIPHNRTFLLLGDSSYSLYLSHGISAPVFLFIWTQLDLDKTVSVVPYVIVYYIYCQVIALACYKLIEKPVNGWIKKKAYGKAK